MSALVDTSHPAYERECPECGQRKHAPCFDQRVTGTKHRKTPHPARTAHLRWQRRDGGYMRADGEWFLMRGAPMSNGGDAWLIHRRVTGERVGLDATTVYDTSNGLVLWRVTDDGYCDTVRAAEAVDVDLYAHEHDAGSLAEAKHVAEYVEWREAA